MSERIPPWVDMETLCWAICACPSSVENYVAQGKLLSWAYEIVGLDNWRGAASECRTRTHIRCAKSL